MEARSSGSTRARRRTATAQWQAGDESHNAEVFPPASRIDCNNVPPSDTDAQDTLTPLATPAYRGPSIDPTWDLPIFRRSSGVGYPREPYKPPSWPKQQQIMTGEKDDRKVGDLSPKTSQGVIQLLTVDREHATYRVSRHRGAFQDNRSRRLEMTVHSSVITAQDVLRDATYLTDICRYILLLRLSAVCSANIISLGRTRYRCAAQ